MKPKPLIHALILACSGFVASTDVDAQLAVGSIADDHNYAEFDVSGNTTGRTIRGGAGNIVVLYYFTPW